MFRVAVNDNKIQSRCDFTFKTLTQATDVLGIVGHFLLSNSASLTKTNDKRSGHGTRTNAAFLEFQNLKLLLKDNYIGDLKSNHLISGNIWNPDFVKVWFQMVQFPNGRALAMVIAIRTPNHSRTRPFKIQKFLSRFQIKDWRVSIYRQSPIFSTIFYQRRDP